MSLFLNIEHKEDTPEKLAAVASKPTYNFLFADEINLAKDKINILWSLMKSTDAVLRDILLKSAKVELGTIATSFIDVLNAATPQSFATPIIIVYKFADVNYVQLFVGTDGNYGDGDLQFTAADFVEVYAGEFLPPVSNRQLFYGELTDYDFIEFKNTLGYEVSCEDASGYAKTNIPIFQTTHVNIENRIAILLDNENTYIEYYNIGGYLAFRNIYTDSLGAVSYVPISHAKIFIEQL